MESFEDRLSRFQDGPPSEVISTLTNSINNFLNPEIAKVAADGSWSLMFMGTHAVALTISESLFGLKGKEGYLHFVRTFMDEESSGANFSSIGAEIHNWRNVLAHQWLSSAGHTFALDSEMEVGWRRRDGLLVANPAKYHEQYRRAFQTSSDIWRPERILSSADLVAAKTRLIEKYMKDR
jgi:hypothetical protein